jgi:hypothetical protein
MSTTTTPNPITPQQRATLDELIAKAKLLSSNKREDWLRAMEIRAAMFQIQAQQYNAGSGWWIYPCKFAHDPEFIADLRSIKGIDGCERVEDGTKLKVFFGIYPLTEM